MLILKKKYNAEVEKLEAANKKIKNQNECLMALEFKYDTSCKEIKYLKQSLADTHVELIECKEYADNIIKNDEILELKIAELKIAELETELSVSKLKNEQLIDDLKDADKDVLEAKDKADKMGKVYNGINNILWNNRESHRQLKHLHTDILNNRYSKNEIASYLNDIILHMGGESKFEYVGGIDIDELD